MREQEGQGATCILLAAAASIVGALAIKDPLKPEAVGVVSALRHMGLQCYMVTGDNWTTARIVAAELGIINVMAEVLPAGKADKVSARSQAASLYSLSRLLLGMRSNRALCRLSAASLCGY